MNYRGFEYQVVQTANPTGWKWTVMLDAERTRTGSAHNRTAAIGLAQRTIEKLIKDGLQGAPSKLDEAIGVAEA